MLRHLAWSFSLVIAGALPVIAADIVIQEIHYAPGDKTVREEFVELYNHGKQPVDLSGWFLGDGISFVFPQGTTLAPGDYVVVAEDPTVLSDTLFVTNPLGPYSGQLSNEGERIVLRNASGGLEDEVTYNDRTPWPVAASGRGSSMELVHPDLDNDLGGSWRPSGFVDNLLEERLYLVDAAQGGWRYRRATSEPPAEWREMDFVENDTWRDAQLPIGFGTDGVQTTLSDMQFSYTGIYLRREFTVTEVGDFLKVGLWVDDGCIVSINGVEVLRFQVPLDVPLAFDGIATRATRPRWIETFLDSPRQYLQPGRNVLAIHAVNVRATSNDFAVDATLFVPSVDDFVTDDFIAAPTPGVQNTVLSTAHPPQVRQVGHDPAAPTSGDAVVITARATDPQGVARVELEYQPVEPGEYIRITDEAYLTEWSSIVMRDDGQGDDEAAGDDVYTATLTGDVQKHRSLVRYRIRSTDSTGKSGLSPFRDDPQPNYAYFVYDGLPAWQGASEPGVSEMRSFSPELLGSLPVYHLIAAQGDPDRSQYSSSADGDHFPGTLVYDGVVYDHIEFENRGEFSTYVSGKNKWKFHFNRSHEFQARDNFGRNYRARWRTMNLSACATPWVPTNRGMAGLGQAVAHKVFSVAGVPSPRTHSLHLRVIDEALEADPADQYRGDLWGLYQSIEHTDGAFLEERGLPDGNAYKIEGSQGDKRNQGRTQTLDSSDYDRLRDGYNAEQSIEWWRTNVNLESYYGFRAVGRAVNNMDLREGWNLAQYHNPETGLWSAIPWDLDMLYMPVTHWSGIMHFQNALTQHEVFAVEYRNRSRTLLDLLFTEEQFRPLVEELAGFVSRPGTSPTFADLDEAMWNHHPRTTGGHAGAFYRNPSTHGARGGTIERLLESADHAGMATWIVDFATSGYGHDFLSENALDEAIPATPTISFAGQEGFALDALRFTVESSFEDPDGNETFGGVEWRLAEVPPVGTSNFDPETPRTFEVEAIWESDLLDDLTAVVQFPPELLRADATYRARARVHDDTGRASHWSEPIEFVAGPRTSPSAAQAGLRITELMYNPTDGSDFEFIELQNVGGETLSLSAVRFTDGIRFDFAESDVQELEAGAYLVLVRDANAFRSRYGDTAVVAGEYGGRLSNGGERVALTYGASSTIVAFAYDDAWHSDTDGAGRSLVVRDPQATDDTLEAAEGWMASRLSGGSPGRGEDDPAPGVRVRPGDLNSDQRVNVADALALLGHLFLGQPGELPCDGDIQSPGNRAVADFDGNTTLELTDALGLLEFIFRRGPPHAAGTGCIVMEACFSNCR